MDTPKSVISRRDFCQGASSLTSALALGSVSGVALGQATARTASNGPWDPGDMEFLHGIATATVKAAHVAPGANKPGGGVNTTGIPLITPGGNYPAFWVRDYAMSLDCGLIGPEEMLPQLKLIARCQGGRLERKLKSGGIVPPYSIPDHIRMDGRPVYYPGTNSPGEDQGGDPWGPLPPADDQFYFIHVAYAYWRDTKDVAFLSDTIEGLTILDRLIKAFQSPEIDPKTGAVVAEPPRRAVGFGFQDSIYMLGAMSFATLLRWRAAKQLGELCATAGRSAEVHELQKTADTIVAHLLPAFSEPEKIGGWLAARRSDAANRMSGRLSSPCTWAYCPKKPSSGRDRRSSKQFGQARTSRSSSTRGRSVICRPTTTSRTTVLGRARLARAAIKMERTGTRLLAGSSRPYGPSIRPWPDRCSTASSSI